MEWVDPPSVLDTSPLEGVHPLVGRALVRRGFRTEPAARAFLDPQKYSPAHSNEIPGLSAAADRVIHAIHYQEPICVWGDFDVDGQTSTTILYQTLRDLGAVVTYHIPNREKEGHGVNIPLLSEILDHGARLILTCDTGISAHQAVDFARRRDVDVVITDHHDLPGMIPPAVAVTNPKFLPEGHPLSTLSGSGVAYKIAEELYSLVGKNDLAGPLMDLACLGLVADVARLTGDARYLVQRGLEVLRTSTRPGLRALFEYAKLIPDHLTEEHISYEIAPRLNALGRLGDANLAVELFTTSDPVRAQVLANILESLNIQRQLLCSQVSRAAEAQLRERPELLDEPVLVLAGPGWPGGVVGIVASRLVDRYHKPAILFSLSPNGPARGSARSVEGINITEAIARQNDLLINFGGHPMAAGLALEAEKLPEFRVRLARTVEAMLADTLSEDQLEIDAWLDLNDLGMDLVNALEPMAPFGQGNERLVLATHDLKVQAAAKIGRNLEHLKLTVVDGAGNSQSVLWWNGAGEKPPGGTFDLAYTLRASDWRGASQLQMEFVDFRLLEPESIQLQASTIQVVDYRKTRDPAAVLAKVRQQPSTVVWAEGEAKQKISGCYRNELEQADNLVVWTTPACPEELLWVLEKVCPKTIFVFGIHEPFQTTEAFLARLAGLLKYVIRQHSGRITFLDLAGAMAERQATIRYGLEWLTACGEIQFTIGTDEELLVSKGTMVKKPEKVRQLWVDIQSLLAESSAYRTYFQRIDKENLLPDS